MARKPTGQIYENRSKTTGKVTSFGVRFRYGGKRHYVTLDATTRKEAGTAAGHLLADVQRGLWTPPEERPPEREPREMPTFAEFASDWYRALCAEGGRDGRGLSPKGREDVLWRLGHLRDLGPLRLDAITVEEVDRFRRRKVTRGGLAPSSINKFIETLSAVLEVAVEYEHIDRNPREGEAAPAQRGQAEALLPRPRRAHHGAPRRGRGPRPRGEPADAALASDLPRRPRLRRPPDRRGARPPLGRPRPRGRDAPRPRHEDRRRRADRRSPPGPPRRAARLCRRESGSRPRRARLRHDRLRRSVRGRRAALAVDHPQPRPHPGGHEREREAREARRAPDAGRPDAARLRRTFASLLVALGRDPAVFMDQMGHTTANLTLSVYAKAMAWRDGERERLRALVEGEPVRATGMLLSPSIGSGSRGPELRHT